MTAAGVTGVVFFRPIFSPHFFAYELVDAALDGPFHSGVGLVWVFVVRELCVAGFAAKSLLDVAMRSVGVESAWVGLLLEWAVRTVCFELVSVAQFAGVVFVLDTLGP